METSSPVPELGSHHGFTTQRLGGPGMGHRAASVIKGGRQPDSFEGPFLEANPSSG